MWRQISLDRIERDIAIGEDDCGNKVEIPVSRLPKGARSPHVLEEINGVLIIDHQETARRKLRTIDFLNYLIYIEYCPLRIRRD